MSHKPEQSRISHARRELRNIRFFATRRPVDESAILARTNHLERYLDSIEDECLKLKQVWKEKHQAHNMATLRIAYLERMLEMAKANNLDYRNRLYAAAIVTPPASPEVSDE